MKIIDKMYLKRVARGITLSFTLIILGALLGYFFRRLLATELSIEDYGMFYAMLSFFGFFMLFVDLGVEQATTKRIVELIEQQKKDEIPRIMRTMLFGQLAVSAFFSILFFLAKDHIAEAYFHNPNVASFFSILIIWFLTTPITTYCAYALLGFQRTTWYTALDAARMTVVLGICLIGFEYNKSLYIPTIAYAAINIILFTGTYTYVKSFIDDVKLFSLQKAKEINIAAGGEIIAYAIPVALTNFGWIILTQTDTLTLTYFTSLKEVGLYNIALPISLLLLFFMRPVIIVFAPLVTEFHAGKKKEKLSIAVTLAYTYLFVLLIPCAIGISLFSEHVISILFDTKYIGAAHALQILAIGTVFYAFSLFNNIIYTGIGEARKIAKTVAAVCILNLILNILFIEFLGWGIIGASLATAICYALLFATSTWSLEKKIMFSFPIKIWLLSILFAAVSASIIHWLRIIITWNDNTEAVLCAMLFMGIYMALILFTKTLDIEKIKELME